MFRSDKYKSKIRLSKTENVILKHKFEIISIFLFAAFSILLLSLLSYNNTDSSWFYISTTNRQILNWCGVVGANISALLFYLFGNVAYAVAFGVAYFSYLIFVNKGVGRDTKRIYSYLFFVISLSAIVNSYRLSLKPFFTGLSNSYPGGFIGGVVSDFIKKPFGLVGSRVILLSVLLVSGVIASRISFFRLTVSLVKILFQFSKTFTIYLYKLSKYLFKYLLRSFVFLALYIKKQIVSFFSSDEAISDDFFIQKEIVVKKGFSDEKVSNIDSSLDKVDENQQDDYFQDNSVKNLLTIFRNVDNKIIHKQLHSFIKNKISMFENILIGRVVRYEFMLKPDQKLRVKLFETVLPNSIFNKNIFSISFANDFIKTLEKYESEKKESFFSKIKKVTKSNFSSSEKKEYILPNVDLFDRATKSDEELKKALEEQGELNGELLEEKLSHFGIKGKVTSIKPGPVITLFEYKPEIDSKISKIVALEDDLALALKAISIRIVAPIPGRSVVGFEISNMVRQTVPLSQLLESKDFKTVSSTLPVVVGVDIVGRPVIQDLVAMPHLLVAGSTGSGKSVGLNTMLVSLLCEFNPDQLKLILIDPKRLEFAPYKDIPHLLFPIITNPRQASPVLKWLVQEMESRYDKMAEAGVRNVSEYQEASINSELEPMPFIVLMIDELADLMMVAGKDIELHIARIAQMARAAGIHMIVATQRPSVDVVTGLIKVNFPSRMAFRVTSKIDSRTIVDAGGAEKLLGKGDMLYMSSGSSDLQRIHGAFVGVKEIEKLTKHLREQGEPQYLDLNETLKEMTKSEIETIEDELYPDVLDFVRTIDELSISGLQRKYRIGFNRSARLIEKLEMDGFIAPAQGSKPRKVIKENL